jgi:DNA repair exonuclease SbcCD nuclease subunit
MTPIRILFLADTHLGFDLPQRPRIDRRRRGHDFFANFDLALQDALSERVDFVLHGGDLFFRSRVPPSLVQRVFLSIKRVADSAVPVFLVPGNHERSRIPYPMLALHPNIHVFDRPRTFTAEAGGTRIAFAGFPYCRHDVRTAFTDLLRQTGWSKQGADINLLCVHHCFEGATVGPHDYTFRYSNDVVRLAEVPPSFAAVLTGHIHRHQVLTEDLKGRPLGVPILYPGSIERTSFAEKDETKGYMMLELGRTERSGGRLQRWEFRQLPARPMLVRDMNINGKSGSTLELEIREIIDSAPREAVLRLRIHGQPDDCARAAMSARSLRALAPATMNVEAVLVDELSRVRTASP